MALQLRRAIAEDLVLLSLAWDGHRGFRFFRTGQPSPYLTARALEGLTAARATQFPVPAPILAAAGGFILDNVDGRGLVAVDDVAWWEGNQAERRMALTAQVFRILAEAGQDAIPMEQVGVFERLRARVSQIASLTNDPLTIANAALGLMAYETNTMGGQLDARSARRFVRRILEVRDKGHWEPSWFHATGGTLQATAAALEMLALLGPGDASAALREASHVLWDARDQLGAWHNTAGAIALMRALATLPVAPAEAQRSSIVIDLDGVQVAKVSIDPADAFASAFPLQNVDLSGRLHPGSHRLTVRSSGTTAPHVRVDIERWVTAGTSDAVVVERHVTKTARLGEEVAVELTVTAKRPWSQVAIEERLPSNTAVDTQSLEVLREKGVIAAYQAGEPVTFYLDQLEGTRTLRYTLHAVRSGEASFGPTVVRTVQLPEQPEITGASQTLIVR
jgi:uncharacterized protein YfaS (alpha-2-macroglobulin family)